MSGGGWLGRGGMQSQAAARTDTVERTAANRAAVVEGGAGSRRPCRPCRGWARSPPGGRGREREGGAVGEPPRTAALGGGGRGGQASVLRASVQPGGNSCSPEGLRD